MYSASFKSRIKVNLGNVLGWRTKRKIVVIESDDWGSIRTKDKYAYESMLNAGLNVDENIHTIADSLECNEDLERLFELLLDFSDVTGRPPVFTPMCIVANPDFNKIRESNFTQYHFEGVDETLKRHPNRDRVLQLWKKGIEDRLFYPGLHGREHVNVRRWMHNIRSIKSPLRKAFENESIGAFKYQQERIIEYLGAFHPESVEEVQSFKNIVEDAGKLFYRFCGYHPQCFIAPNLEEPKEMESFLKGIGVKYMTRSKKRQYPIGNGKFKNEFNWLGKRSKIGTITLVRNCFFEPVNWVAYPTISDWTGNCLKEIEIAFRWNKPAIISTHRVNYIGSISPENRDKGLKELKTLLIGIMKKWPEAEFMTSGELGALIDQNP